MSYKLASSSWDREEITAIQSVIDSDNYTMGSKVQEFEELFAAYTGSKFAVMVNSGSSANLLMVAALRYVSESPLLPGDEVIVPAVSWGTTYFPLMQYGLKLRFVDIDSKTLNIDLKQLEDALTKDTKAIFAVNLLGNPNNFELLQQFTQANNLTLIEDNCESLGATFQNKQAGSFGRMGSFSCFYSHHISTMEGGVVVTDDEELYQILVCLRAHGWTRNLPTDNHISKKSHDSFVESFRFVLPGYNLRPLEMSGAIGLQQIAKLPELIEQRRNNAEQFLNAMKAYPFITTQQETGNSSWFGFSMVLNDPSSYDRATILRLMTEQNIEIRPIVSGNFLRNEALKWANYSVHGSCINADMISDHGFFIGNHHYPIHAELELLQSVLDKL